MAAELVGGTLLSSFLQVAFEKMLNSGQVVDYFRRRRLNETLLEKLRIKLLSFNSVLDDAEDKHITNLHVKSWLDRVKDAVLDAEDLLDEIDTEASKRELEAEYKTNATKVFNYFSASVSSFDKKVESGIEKLLDSLEVLANEKDMLGLKEGSGVGKKAFQRLSTTSLVDVAAVYGREKDKKVIIDLLLSHHENCNNPSVISVLGMGGMGKTTLAQLVYNDTRVEDEFDLKAWVCVSEEFDVLRVTRTILEAITLSKDDTDDMNMLQVKLKEKLTGKKFLLVLDDVWNVDYFKWEALAAPFINGAQGSKILVTTRSDKVSSTMRAAKQHQLKQLAEDDSWLLFTKHAFRDDDLHSNAGLEEIGRKIIKKCKGLPLALKVIGSILYTKLSLEEWNNVLTSDMWETSSTESNIIPALRLSYQYLPSHLKRCFAYCSLFPKDYEFDKDHLICLWMAEDFLPCNQQNKSMKEVGDQFFQDLLSISFFQRSSEDATRFVMHDLVNDLAKYVSGEFCYRMDSENAPRASKVARHFSYSRYWHDYSKRFNIIYDANRLRTFIPLSMDRGQFCYGISSKMIHELLARFRRLRVLSLSGYYNVIELPDFIDNLKLLRYLDLSGTGVKRLPDSVCSLYNLQTLKLRYCESLEELPSNMHKLRNLRHLDFYGTKVRKMPKGLEKLKHLEVLTTFFVGKYGEHNINQLAKLNLRGTVSIFELQNVADPKDALAANLKNKIYLKGLRLEWNMKHGEFENEKDVLETLQPHSNIKELSIENYGGSGFPYWFEDNSLSNIVALELINCKSCSRLPLLGILPSLKKLLIAGLDGLVVIGSEFYGNNSSTASFGSLEVLHIVNLAGLEEWECQTTFAIFPCLKELVIKECPKLKKQLPQQLPSLVKLVILNCARLTASLPQAPAIHDLCLENCENLQWESPPSTLKNFSIKGPCKEPSFLEKIYYIITNTCLESLRVDNCPHIEFPRWHSPTFLRTIIIDGSYNSLKDFPLDFFPELQMLSLKNFSSLERFSISDEHDLNLTSLTVLEIHGCPKFVSFPKGGFFAPNLDWCSLDHLDSLKSLPQVMRTLMLTDCPQVKSFPVGGLRLCIRSCPKLIASRMNWDSINHASLVLWIEDANLETLPDEGLLPLTLTSLVFWRCSKLKTLDHKGISHLSSLKMLIIADCPSLRRLPKEGLPSSLSTLEIRGDCRLLKQRCQKQRGKDWNKIAHISCVKINHDIIT